MILKNLSNKKIVLASKSPRRQDLLKGLELEFEIRTKDVKEDYPDHLEGKDVAEYLAKLKAEAFQDDLLEDEILITSDTVVLLEDAIIEKPSSFDEAVKMIQSLSNRTHHVVTGVAITTTKSQVVFHDKTEVQFNELTDEEIEYYIENYEPYDKAGSYGVQELIGYIGIRKINGCYYNVMGLPLQKLYAELKKM